MLQNQIVSRLNSQSHEQIVATSLRFWEAIAAELTPIVGKDGFAMLYQRCLHLCREKYTWLGVDEASLPSDSSFIAMKSSFEMRDAAEACAASIALFLTFTDLLALLIGEPLTERLLQVFWIRELEADSTKER